MSLPKRERRPGANGTAQVSIEFDSSAEITATPSEPQARLGDGGFDWSDDSAVVLREQPATAVYFNPRGQVVIRQQGEVFDDDPFVFFNVESLPALIAALTSASKA